MKTYFVSDWHLGEDRFELMQRPFKTVDEHNKHLIDCHNELVKPEDTVYFIGDVIYQKADASKFLPLIAKFNGKKTLIRGNHDRHISDEDFKPYFERIVPEGDGIALTVGEIRCWLTHYPTCGKVDMFNIVGHIHGIWKLQLNSLNVGVDANHFRPTPADRIPFFMKAVTEFYDMDAWAGYVDVNAKHTATRGKKTSYFQK